MKTFRLAALILGASLLLAACGSAARSYPNLKDADYNLEAMAPGIEDVPDTFEPEDLGDGNFDNEAWAEFFDATDTDAKIRQLDAQGRISVHVTSYSSQELGKGLFLNAFSTLYQNETSASAALQKFSCGLPVNDAAGMQELAVPRLGQESTGFIVSDANQTSFPLTDVTVCFRTGRLVHAVQLTGLRYNEDIQGAVRAAQGMEKKVNAAFDKAGK